MLYYYVSIPNGMEFYKTSCRCFTRARRFNSQRDGILRDANKLALANHTTFQFPTGWNSTERILKINKLMHSFNSQRDGILPTKAGGVPRAFAFQFPTGWNSTLHSNLFKCNVLSFNSQRDGILQFGFAYRN